MQKRSYTEPERYTNVPRPYPDELIYSVWGRFGMYFALNGRKTVSRALYGDGSLAISTLLPARLERLRWLIEESWGMTLEAAALQHTILPFYLLADWPGRPATQDILAAVCRDVASQLFKTLGITAATVRAPAVLRYCPACVRQDRELHGEAYWHRQHQLPGVMVCSEHAELLRRSAVPVRSSIAGAPVAAEMALTRDAAQTERIPERALVRAHEFAAGAFEALARSDIGGRAPVDWSRLLASRGYGRRHGGLAALEDDFVGYWGSPLLGRIERRWSPGGHLPWLRAIRHKSPKALHPTRQLLLSLFLASCDASVGGFPDGPVECPNWLAPHHGRKVVGAYDDIRDHRHPERTIRRYTCSCGFVFTRFAKPIAGTRDFRIVRFGPLFRAAAHRLAGDGLTVRAIARVLDVDWATANRFVAAPEPASDGTGTGLKSDRMGDRAAWRDLIVRYPVAGTSSLRARAPALYARLYRQDRVWLAQNSPPKRIPAAQTRVDWRERDLAFSDAIRHVAAVSLRDSPNKRITKTRLFRGLAASTTVEKNLHRLPLTHEAIRLLCEDKTAYRVRRLQEAAAKMGADTPVWKLIREAGLRAEHVSDGILKRAGVIPPSLKGDRVP